MGELSDVQLRKLPSDFSGILKDGNGLRLNVLKTGTKTWQHVYRFDKKVKTLTYGTYPNVSLAKARELAVATKEALQQKIDPALLRQDQDEESYFFYWVKFWFEHKCSGNTLVKLSEHKLCKERFKSMGWQLNLTPSAIKSKNTGWEFATAKKALGQLFNHVLPAFKTTKITDIRAQHILAITDRIIVGNSGHDVARDIIEILDQIFRKAARHIELPNNPAYRLKEELPQYTPTNYAAITDPDEFGQLLMDIERYEGTFITRQLLKIAPYLWQRPGEVRLMEWGELDLEHQIWQLDGEKMKMKKPHIVPLPTQAVVILKALQPATGSCRYVFTSNVFSEKIVSDNTINKALRSLGYKDRQTFHGFRASARTILAERLRINPDLLEIQLAHKTKNVNGTAYERTQFIEDRIEMMQKCADFYDLLRENALNDVKLGAKFFF